MPFARINGVTHHYALAGPAGAPAVAFVNSLGTDFRIWDQVAAEVAKDHRVLLYDKRGHGLSGIGATPYAMETLTADLAGLMDHAGLRDPVICGVSVGGMIAQQLSTTRPDLVRALVLCDTLARFGDPQMWLDRVAKIEAGGLAAIVDGMMQRWFGPGFHERSAVALDGYRNMFLRQPAEGYIATCFALRDADLTPLLARIAVPTVVVVGADDGASPPDKVEAFARAIPGARFELLPDCGHIPSVEQPQRLTASLRSFLSQVASERVSHAHP